jgi:hypothetical protein
MNSLAGARMEISKLTLNIGFVARAVVKFSGCSFQELKAIPAVVLKWKSKSTGE